MQTNTVEQCGVSTTSKLGVLSICVYQRYIRCVVNTPYTYCCVLLVPLCTSNPETESAPNLWRLEETKKILVHVVYTCKHAHTIRKRVTQASLSNPTSERESYGETCPSVHTRAYPADADRAATDPAGRVAVAGFLALLSMPIPLAPTMLDKFGENPTACRASSAMQVGRSIFCFVSSDLEVQNVHRRPD